jgi:DNA-directed RNA polymerase specialized sigma24 family protein
MENYLDLIRSIAWSFHRTTGIEWDELFSEACLGYCEAERQYDASKNKGKKSSYLYRCITTQLQWFLTKEQRNRFFTLDAAWDPPTDQEHFFEVYECFSDDAKELIALIIDDPNKFLTGSPKTCRGEVAYYLVGEKNWTYTKVWKTFRSVKSTLNSLV